MLNESSSSLTDEQKRELNRRLQRLQRTGSKGSPWPVVKRRIKNRTQLRAQGLTGTSSVSSVSSVAPPLRKENQQ
jgi:hypothetical protein